MIVLFGIIVYVICTTSGLLLLKISLSGVSLNSIWDAIHLITNLKFISGFALYATSFLTWMFLLNKKDLSFIFPIVIGLTYLAVFLSALFLLQEQVTTRKIIAASLIGIGIIIISFQK